MAIGERVAQFAGHPVEDYNPDGGIVLPVLPRSTARRTATSGRR
jgi:hypothetical protein